MSTSQIRQPYLKHILYALVIAAGGFALAGLAFMLAFLVQSLFDLVARPNPENPADWVSLARNIALVVIIAVISWLVFRSRLPSLAKAVYLTVPTAVVLVMVGILLYPSTFLPYIVGAVLVAGVLFYFYRSHQPWFYFYSVILTALVLLVMGLTGVEI